MLNRIVAVLAALMFVTGSFAACGEEDPAENQQENQYENDNDGEHECETNEDCHDHEDFGEDYVCDEDTNECVEDDDNGDNGDDDNGDDENGE